MVWLLILLMWFFREMTYPDIRVVFVTAGNPLGFPLEQLNNFIINE